MRQRIFVVLTLGLALVAVPEVWAQSLDYGALAKLFGEPVTTSVTGSPQRQSEVPATMVVVTAADIRRSGARSISEVLSHVPGVDVLHWTRDQADVAVRGYNQAYSPRLLVLVDGRQVYADYYGFTPWSAIPVELADIRQIEVIKGPNAALYGFNAVGGVINIITYDPRYDDINDVQVAAGTGRLRQASVVSTFGLGPRGGLSFSAGTRNDDDFATPLPHDWADVRGGNKRDAARLSGRFNLSDKIQFNFDAAYSDAAQTEMQPLYTLSFDRYRTRALKAQLAAETAVGLVQATVYKNRIESRVTSDSVGTLEFDNAVTVAKLEDLVKIGTRHTFRLTGEYRDSRMGTAPVTGGRIGYRVASLGAMWNWSMTPRLAFTNALRLDRFSLDRSGYFPPGLTEEGLTDADWNRRFDATSFNSGLVWQAGQAGTLRFTVGRGQQLPNLLELGGLVVTFHGFISGGMPGLEPMRVTQYEVAWDRLLPGARAHLRIAAFDGRSDEVITDIGNVGHSDTTGMEFSLTGKIGENWRWGASYVPQQITDHFVPAATVAGTRTDYGATLPDAVVKAYLGWSRGSWEVDGYLRYKSAFDGVQSHSGEFFVDSALVPIPAYAALDARVAYRVSKRLTLAISGRNLTHHAQQQTSGPGVERELFVTLGFAF